MQNLVYVAHSREKDLKRARFSILNLQYFAKEMDSRHRIVVYTDSPGYFNDLDVLVEEMDNITISMWQGARNSDERVRIMAARDAFATYHGNVILVRNEVFYIDNPSPMFLELYNNSSLMYEETSTLYSIGGQLPETINYLSVEPYQKSAPKTLPTPPPNTSVYDMAIIGLHENDRGLIKKVLCYFDALMGHLPEKLAAAAAFSHVLGSNTLLQEANDWVDTYEPNSTSIDALLQTYFRENEGLPIEVQPTEAWRLAHQLDGSSKYASNNILNLVRELNH